MKKFFTIFVVVVLIASCTRNYNEISVSADIIAKNAMTNEERAKQLVVDMLNRIDPQTRGYVREIERVEFISKERLLGTRTRTEADSTDTDGGYNFDTSNIDGLVILNFKDSTGYGLIGVGSMVGEPEEFEPGGNNSTPIGLLAITDSGTITSDEILSYGDEWSDGNNTGNNNSNNDSTHNDLYVAEDDDYLIGGSEPAEFMHSLLYAYATYADNQGDDTVEDVMDYTKIENISSSQRGPLLNTKWWQELPFNYYVHTYDDYGHKRPVGCVTVAVAQVLTYFKNRDIKYYFSVDPQTTWTMIEEEEYQSGCNPLNQIQYDAAKIMKKIADRIDVKYNYWGRGTFATPKQAQRYLESEFGYNITREIDGRKAKRLKQIIVSLNNNKPVIMAALGKAKYGHAWVVDGYAKNPSSTNTKSDFFIHCNFGWGGVSDGWYLIDALHSSNNDNGLLDDPSLGEDDFVFNWMYRYLFF